MMEVKASGGAWIIADGTRLLQRGLESFAGWAAIFQRWMRRELGWCVALEAAQRAPFHLESSVQGFWSGGGGLWESSLMLSADPRAGHHPPDKP